MYCTLCSNLYSSDILLSTVFCSVLCMVLCSVICTVWYLVLYRYSDGGTLYVILRVLYLISNRYFVRYIVLYSVRHSTRYFQENFVRCFVWFSVRYSVLYRYSAEPRSFCMSLLANYSVSFICNRTVEAYVP